MKTSGHSLIHFKQLYILLGSVSGIKAEIFDLDLVLETFVDSESKN